MSEIEQLLWKVHPDTLSVLCQKFCGGMPIGKTRGEMIAMLKDTLSLDALKFAYPESLNNVQSVGDIKYVGNPHFNQRNVICSTCGK